MVGDLNIRIAKLAFHAKESPFQTRDGVFNLVSSLSWSPAEGIVRPSGHPLIQDSLTPYPLELGDYSNMETTYIIIMLMVMKEE